ncbi:MAG: family intrarane metalloprotease [Clostridia bacterium]|nr:family intrarane metalloprotease [Clostridia bacterium]
MKKIISIIIICGMTVATLTILSLFEFENKEIVFSAVSIIYLLFGSIFLKILTPNLKFKKFLKFNFITFKEFDILFWLSWVVISGGFLLNLAVVTICEKMNLPLPVNSLEGMSTENFWLSIFSITVIPSIFEELFFRGAVLSALEERGKFVAVVISSIMFFVVHGSYNYALTTIFAGIIFSVLVYVTNSIYAAMLAHFLNNIMSYLLFIYSSKLSIVGMDVFVIYGLLLVFLISIYGSVSAITKKYKRKLRDEVRIYNEGELIWEKQKRQALKK